jgi:6-phosphogluconolactonase
VVWFRRGANGKLSTAKTPVSTGGKGLAMTPPFGFPTADGEGWVNLTPDGKLLFVVNAGDNTVSSFLVKKSGPKLVSHISSGGTLPISLTSNGHLLYVVNETDSMGGNGNIYGFSFSKSGHLKPLNSTQPLDTKGPVGTAADPAQIDFSPDGRTLSSPSAKRPKTHETSA